MKIQMNIRQRGLSRLIAPAILCSVVILGGCASTEDLYAEYDANNCPVQIAAVSPVKTVIRDRVTAETMLWRQAVYFDFDQDKLTPETTARLDEDIEVLKRYPVLQVALRGFTDERGSLAYNRDLAERRSSGVENYLKQKGIAASRLKQAPLGEELPLLQGQSEAVRSVNRRVELLLLDQRGQPLDFGFSVQASQMSAVTNPPPAPSSASKSQNVAKTADDPVAPSSTDTPAAAKRLTVPSPRKRQETLLQAPPAVSPAMPGLEVQ